MVLKAKTSEMLTTFERAIDGSTATALSNLILLVGPESLAIGDDGLDEETGVSLTASISALVTQRC